MRFKAGAGMECRTEDTSRSVLAFIDAIQIALLVFPATRSRVELAVEKPDCAPINTSPAFLLLTRSLYQYSQPRAAWMANVDPM